MGTPTFKWKNTTINSGCCTGNDRRIPDLQGNGPWGRGTDGEYNGELGENLKEGETLNSGALSGGKVAGAPSSQPASVSDVTGTRNSFNISGTGSSRSRTPLTIGTEGSFNANGKESKIDALKAIINSGCCAGNDDDVVKLIEDLSGGCSGTERSFNTALGEINVKDAKLNTGAYSGNGTQKRGTRRSHSASDPEWPPRWSESSFNNNMTFNRAIIDAADHCKLKSSTGTQESFNVKQNSTISADGAIINSGYCAGNGKVPRNLPDGCIGTRQSFNADSGGGIIIEKAILNTGAGSTDRTK